MKRRDFILGLGGAALFANSARGQQNSPIARHSATKLRIADLPFTLANIRFSEIADADAARRRP
jgi:hypothetical protein